MDNKPLYSKEDVTAIVERMVYSESDMFADLPLFDKADEVLLVAAILKQFGIEYDVTKMSHNK